MPRPQTSIITDNAQAGIFIEADIRVHRYDDIKTACRSSLEALAKLKTHFPEDILGMTIAFGSDAWKAFGHAEEGSEIKPFPVMGNGLAPSTQHDIYIHIQACRQKAAFALAQSVFAAFGDSISIATEEHGLRLYEDRGLDGFVDGTENPDGEDRDHFAKVGKEDAKFKGGSYVFVQKYFHKMQEWNATSVSEQEKVIGRSKEYDIEMDESVKPTNSHSAAANVGDDKKVVRGNMPFTEGSKTGTYFIAYASTFSTVELMLKKMFIGEPKGNSDRLLDFSTPVTGALYFAPTLDMLGDYEG